jgi:hypothetical protein
VTDSDREDPGREHRRCLRTQAGAAECDHPAGGAGAQERAKRCGQRCGGKILEGGALRTTPALEHRAVLALAQVRAEASALSRGEAACVQLRERDLGLLAGEAPLELLAERATRTEEQSLDSREGEFEYLADLRVRTAFELSHDERGALVEVEEAERIADLYRGRDILVGCRCGVRFFDGEGDFVRAALRVAEALSADVVRDLDQPVVRELGALAAAECAVGGEEGGLGDVLGVGLVVEDRQRIAVDRVHVLFVEPLEGAVCARWSLREEWCHVPGDAVSGRNLRSGRTPT